MPHKAGEIFIKDPDWYLIDDTIRAPIIANIQDSEKHEEHKKVLAPAFAPKALNQQQDIILKYVNMLMTAIKSESWKGPINLVEFYNWVTSNVIGELAFSESFGSIENRKTNSWIATLLNVTKWGAWDAVFYRLSPWMWKHLHLVVPRKMTEAALQHLELSKIKIFDRMGMGDLGTRDFCSYLFEIRDEIGLSNWSLTGYAQLLIMAGSETIATTFSALTYYLCRTPAVYEKLKDEVRGHFESADEINSHSSAFRYMTAVINEALRIYPPVPIGSQESLPRAVR